MARIVCFTDNTAVARAIQQSLADDQHTLHFMSASRLTEDSRRSVRRFAPDIILLELAQTIDNPHLFFFLRSDMATRTVPIIVLSSGARLAQQAAMLGADGYLQRQFLGDHLSGMVAAHTARSTSRGAFAAA
jgi:DNA-binding response OmpR family regulator